MCWFRWLDERERDCVSRCRCDGRLLVVLWVDVCRLLQAFVPVERSSKRPAHADDDDWTDVPLVRAVQLLSILVLGWYGVAWRGARPRGAIWRLNVLGDTTLRRCVCDCV